MSSQIPERIGRYQVEALLGHGGMGNVYLAVDPRLKRQLAIKTVRNREEDDQDQTLERFSREAEISAQLCHPNIITIYDVGEDPREGAFLAMEYVKGQSLAAHIRDRRPGLEASLFLLVQAMRALQAAHDGAIIHRDIKPENMMVSDTGRLKLMDFGLARGSHSRLTATGMVLGTPSFTAPELMMGKESSTSSDRYAFSVTAFELLSGELPFKGDTLGSTLYRIVHEPPTIPQGMEAPMAAVFLRALTKEPQHRYPDLASFMLDLIAGCPLPQSIQAKLLGLVEAESSGQEIQAREAASQAAEPSKESSSDSATQIVLTPQPTKTPGSPSSAPKPTPHPPGIKLPILPKAVPPPRHSGPPIKLPSLHLQAKATEPKPPRKTTSAPVLTPPGISLKPSIHLSPPPRLSPTAPRLSPPIPELPPQNLRPQKTIPARAVQSPPRVPPPAGDPAPERPTPGPGLPEPIFDLKGGLIDDPFEGLDWDTVLAQEPTTGEELYQDLEASLGGSDVLGAEEKAEGRTNAQAQLVDLEQTLGGLTGIEILEAEERAEAEESLHSLEDELAHTDLPDLNLPEPPPPSPKPSPRALPPPPEFGH